MKTELQNHYQTIQQTIGQNLETIRALIKQSESLQKIVASIPETDENGDDIKVKLNAEIENISGSIDKLISDTDRLFTLYKEFIDKCLVA